jgi:hypothetical protein
MLIREVTMKAEKPPKPTTAAQQRVLALKTQLSQARDRVKRERLAAQQTRLNQARAERARKNVVRGG